jgi:uncharacterized protein YggE
LAPLALRKTCLWIIWHGRYPDLKPIQKEWLDSCIAEAKERAAHIAAALGVKLLAIHSFSEVWKDPEEVAIRASSAEAPRLRELTREHIDLGFNLSHSKVVEQRVDLTYVVDRRELVANQAAT